MSDYYERDEVGEGPRFAPIGPRREPDAVELFGTCHNCGGTIKYPPVRLEFQPTRTFCTLACRDAWVRR